eukprot:1683110-Amphidinium_carterae.1
MACATIFTSPVVLARNKSNVEDLRSMAVENLPMFSTLHDQKTCSPSSYNHTQWLEWLTRTCLLRISAWTLATSQRRLCMEWGLHAM